MQLHNTDTYAQFVEFFVRGVPADRFHMAMPRTLYPGMVSRTMAGWAQQFVQSRSYGHELQWHLEPATALALDAKTYYDLVMGRGDDYAVDLLAFDALGDEPRKTIANNVVAGISACGCVPWHSSIRDVLSQVDTEKMIFWRRRGTA